MSNTYIECMYGYGVKQIVTDEDIRLVATFRNRLEKNGAGSDKREKEINDDFNNIIKLDNLKNLTRWNLREIVRKYADIAYDMKYEDVEKKLSQESFFIRTEILADIEKYKDVFVKSPGAPIHKNYRLIMTDKELNSVISIYSLLMKLGHGVIKI